MSLIPAFKIGLWNAWILMLYLPLHPLIMILLDKLVGVGNITKKMGSVPYNKAEKRIMSSSMILLILAFIYSIFLPLKLGTVWLYIGIPTYLFGLVVFVITIVSIATTPHGEPFTKGLYRYSRHPMTLFSFFVHLGVGIATASWVFILFSVVCAVLWFVLVIPEERGCLERYSNAYREYMNRTPRWLGVPK
ncbi:MAG TPA: isoprenylcysteine carboxylmethyltransferase family protein [Dehalococcoidia bacterium]|nr:isoprenylcysteine carboxylmethyltransferase family protein [Dehalococcoidia bacterium]